MLYQPISDLDLAHDYPTLDVFNPISAMVQGLALYTRNQDALHLVNVYYARACEYIYWQPSNYQIMALAGVYAHAMPVCTDKPPVIGHKRAMKQALRILERFDLVIISGDYVYKKTAGRAYWQHYALLNDLKD